MNNTKSQKTQSQKKVKHQNTKTIINRFKKEKPQQQTQKHQPNDELISQKTNSLDFPIYNSILDTTNILSTLVKNITNDEIFQKHVRLLNESEKPEDVKKAQTINDTIVNMRIFGTKVNPLFLAKDIGILLGIPHIKYIIRKFDYEEMIVGYIKMTNNKIKKVIFLTRHGIYRCFYVSRSPLARLFRKFIGNLIDHMITHETEILHKISAAFKTDNLELIEQGISDLNNKVAELELQYIEEKNRAELLSLQCADEQKKRCELEQENTEIDIINSYNMMYIEQLKKDKANHINQIKNIQNALIPDDESIDTLEIKLIKEKYMKPVYIYILHPTYFRKLLSRHDSTLPARTDAAIHNTGASHDIIEDDTESLKEFEENIGRKHSNVIRKNQNSTEDIHAALLEMPTYKKNYDNIFVGGFDTTSENNSAKIDKDEILYFYINFSRNVLKKDKIIYIDTQWVANKIHFSKLINSLVESCSILTFNKLTLFKTSLDEINGIIREEFVTL